MHALLKHHLLIERFRLVLIEVRVLFSLLMHIVALDTSHEAHGSRRPLASIELRRVLELTTLLDSLKYLRLVEHGNEASLTNVEIERCLTKLPLHLVLLLSGGCGCHWLLTTIRSINVRAEVNGEEFVLTRVTLQLVLVSLLVTIPLLAHSCN